MNHKRQLTICFLKTNVTDALGTNVLFSCYTNLKFQVALHQFVYIYFLYVLTNNKNPYSVFLELIVSQNIISQY